MFTHLPLPQPTTPNKEHLPIYILNLNIRQSDKFNAHFPFKLAIEVPLELKRNI